MEPEIVALLERVAKSQEALEKSIAELISYQRRLHAQPVPALDQRFPYLAGRQPRRDGDSYGTPAPSQDRRNVNHPSGALRTIK